MTRNDRTRAAHVEAALSRTAPARSVAAQPVHRPGAPASGGMAAHVAAAVRAGATPATVQPSAAARGPAPHVRAALAGAAPGTPPRPPAPSVQRAPAPPPPRTLQARLASVPPSAPGIAARLPSGAVRVPAPAGQGGVVQRAEWRKTSGAIETTAHKKGHGRRWIWAPDLTVNIGGILVKPHPVHGKSVSVGTRGNKLWASYTLVWVAGEEMKQENVTIAEGPILGPVEAKLSGTGKDGHTEQQIGKSLLAKIEVPLTAPVEDELEAIIIEIHQTNTPCSGPMGCARYLEDKIMDAIENDTKVPTLILRASAAQVYESQLVPTHPGHGSVESREIIPDWRSYGLEGESIVVHNKPWQ